MNKTLRLTLGPLILLATLFSPATRCAYGQEEDASFKPDVRIQEWIKHAVTLNTQDEITNEISRIRTEGYGVQDLLRQTLYFQASSRRLYTTGKIPGTEVENNVLVADGLMALLLDWDRAKNSLTPKSRDELIDAVLPYLETEDAALRQQAKSALRWVDQTTGSKKDFTGYESYLKAIKDHPSETLIAYMYVCDPQAAVLSMSRVYGDKGAETELADKLKGDPKFALQSLSDRPEWWARLYVAETMEKHPELRDPAILKKLEKDDNPLVKGRVTDITSGK